MDWTTWINTIVGVIGIIVGVIGWRNLSAAMKVKNSVKADTVQQAQIIQNGLDAYAVVRLSRETTQEELKRVIETLQPQWEELNDLVDKKVNSALDERIVTNEEFEEWLKEI